MDNLTSAISGRQFFWTEKKWIFGISTNINQNKVYKSLCKHFSNLLVANGEHAVIDGKISLLNPKLVVSEPNFKILKSFDPFRPSLDGPCKAPDGLGKASLVEMLPTDGSAKSMVHRETNSKLISSSSAVINREKRSGNVSHFTPICFESPRHNYKVDYTIMLAAEDSSSLTQFPGNSNDLSQRSNCHLPKPSRCSLVSSAPGLDWACPGRQT